MPSGTMLDGFHNPPAEEKVKGPAKYFQDFSKRMSRVYEHFAESTDVSVAPFQSWNLDAADALEAAARQKDFFKKVDQFQTEDIDDFPHEVPTTASESM